ncbi:hypothetical protein Bca101_060538 [Brassica carinata]
MMFRFFYNLRYTTELALLCQYRSFRVKYFDHVKKNVTILVQGALSYESMEKYKLGAKDLRMVLKIDPGNKIARSTVHRLNKMAG